MSGKEKLIGKDAEEYHELLKRLGLEEKEKGQHENRVHRRFRFDTPETKFFLDVGYEVCLLNDVSVGGLSFFSKSEFELGKELELNFDNKFQVEVIVVNSCIDKAEALKNASLFRNGCRFISENDGYRCVIVVLKQYLGSL